MPTEGHVQLVPCEVHDHELAVFHGSLRQRGSLLIWLGPEKVWTPPLSGKLGWQQQFNDVAIQACLTLKVLLGMPLAQTSRLMICFVQRRAPPVDIG